MKAKTTPKRLSKKQLLAIGISSILAGAVILFCTLGVSTKIKHIYYEHQARHALSDQNDKLGKPLEALGFTNIQKSTSCENSYGSNQIFNCVTELRSTKVFGDHASQSKAIAAATQLSANLKQNGWHQGNYEVGNWFKDVLNKVDYNADAYHYKYFGKTFCVLDFFVAYSNPQPPAVNAVLSCTTPVLNPPVN